MKTRIAFLILAHSNVEQLNMFIAQLLASGDCEVFVHLDLKNKELINSILKDKRVHSFSKYSVEWGSIEIVLAAIDLMKRASESSFTHYYFGSGQDLMLNNNVYSFLEKTNKKMFIKVEGIQKRWDLPASQYLVRWPRWLMKRGDFSVQRFIRIGISALCRIGIVLFRNKMKCGFDTIYYGRTWFVCDDEITRYFLNYLDVNPHYIKFWEKSLAPDLFFFHTIVMNSQYANDVEDELMYVKFGDKFGSWNHPLTITVDDIAKIDTNKFFFARKFDMNDDKEVINHYVNKTKNQK